MRITQECDYAIRIMVALAGLENGKILDASAISSEQNIPSRFAVKILRKLVLSKLVSSKKGANGGYMLGRSASQITLLNIVETIDGPIAVNRCIGSESSCNTAACSVHKIMLDINSHITEKLQSITLKDLC
ncbi:MAG: Rrf2 family transcriptional regulator [Ruminococcaceae bacterium]|jgi:Rrf2 family protein|nr:Rrf2 family transcriptional regulator [Oscillospiraceae bacterium]